MRALRLVLVVTLAYIDFVIFFFHKKKINERA